MFRRTSLTVRPCNSRLKSGMGFPRKESIWLAHRRRFRAPDVSCVFRNGAIAGELPGPGDVVDGLRGPRWPVAVERRHLLLRLHVTRQVGEVHVEVALGQERV